MSAREDTRRELTELELGQIEGDLLQSLSRYGVSGGGREELFALAPTDPQAQRALIITIKYEVQPHSKSMLEDAHRLLLR